MNQKLSARKEQSLLSLPALCFVFTLTFALISLVGPGNVAYAQVAKRSISLDFEEVPESSGYEVEVSRVMKDGTKKAPVVFKTQKATWTAKIFPGKYLMRLRSIDDRGVAGDWSEPSEFWVKLPPAQPVSPQAGAKITTQENEKSEVDFKWQPVSGAGGYRVEVLGPENQVIESKDVSETSTKMELAVAKSYRWRVAVKMPEGDEFGELSQDNPEFTLVGKKLEKPTPDRPDTKFVTEVKWSAPPFAEKYAYALMRKQKDGKWQVIERKADVKEAGTKLDPKAPGGNYRLQVKAIGSNRVDSDTATMDFYVYEGLRTPAAIDSAMLKEAIEKEYNQYFIGSYLISSLAYDGQNAERKKSAKYQVLSGTGRLGYGYMPKGKWGFVGMADLGGVIIEEKNHLFGSAELQAVWRSYIMRVTQLRVYAGGFMKQMPVVIPAAASGGPIEVQSIAYMGPHVGTMLWHPFTYRFGLQLNAQAYYGMMGLSTPNGQPVSPTLSYQAGAMGSYKYKDNITGFAGYAYRVDSIAYKAKPYDGSATDTSRARDGDINEVSLTGHYLNLYLEWGF